MELEKVVKIMVESLKPYSIFLYGSKATNSDNINSDYEIGIIFEDEKYVSRKEISKLINDKQYSIFPFKLSELINCNIDTPFQKTIYLNVLLMGGAKTLYGVPVLQNLKAPEITKKDLREDINFNLGMALCSVRVFKSGNISLANDLFYKSCFYVTRDYIYFRLKKLCLSYNEIYEVSNSLEDLSEYKELLDIAYDLRNNPDAENQEQFYYKNISYINKFILEKIV